MVNLSDSRINTTGSFFGRPLSTFVCSLNEGRFQIPSDQHFQILSMLFFKHSNSDISSNGLSIFEVRGFPRKQRGGLWAPAEV
jgi:hypothetical protein